MAKVKSWRRGDETGIENCLTKGGKMLAIKKEENKKQKTFQVGKKALSFDEWTAKVSGVRFAEHAQVGNAHRDSPLCLNLQPSIRNLVKTSFFTMFQYLCFWQLSSSRKHKGSNGNICYLCAYFSKYVHTVLPGFSVSYTFSGIVWHLPVEQGSFQDTLVLKPYN